MVLKSLWATLIIIGAMFLGSNDGNATGGTRHWARHSPSLTIITLYDATNDLGWNLALRDLAAEWNAGMEHTILQFGIGKVDCENGNGPYTVVVCIHLVDPENGGEAHTRYDNKNHFKNSRIWMDSEARAKWHLSCHELGHILGLNHRLKEDTKSCMTRTAGWGHPDLEDFQRVNAIHAHVHL